MKKRKAKSSFGKKLLTALCCVLALLLVCLIFAGVYMDRLLGLIDRQPQLLETLSPSELYEIENQTDAPEEATGPEIDPSDVTWSTEPHQTIDGEHLINILLIGQDRREGQGRQRSDAMILCTVNTESGTLTMTSFLRDLYVQIPGYQDNRLNAAYAIGGMPLLNKTLEQNFGIHVDGNIEVDFSQFKQIIDLMGGVDIELTGAEANHLNSKHHYALTSGVNHLDGAQALAYSRIRYIGTDFGRTNRQRTVLTALVDQSRDLSLKKLSTLLEGVLGLITTDMTDAQILDHMLTCFPLLKGLEVNTQYIPAEGTYQFARVRGMSVIVANMESNRQLLLDTIME